MIFRNLPVEFDEEGRPVLRESRETAYTIEGKTVVDDTAPTLLAREEVEDLMARSRFVRTFTVDSVGGSSAARADDTDPEGWPTSG